MCTAMVYKTKNCYFGRNLDLEYTYTESIAITPRNFGFQFRKAGKIENGYAIIGMAYVKDNYPLYYDAMNEKGLGIAGLNFPYNAHYNEPIEGKINISPFEFIPYILSLCGTIQEVKSLLEKVNIANISFSKELPTSPLHWIISDKNSSITVESVKRGLQIFDNPYGVLTNNPPFDKQLLNYSKYLHLSADEDSDVKVDEYFSRGASALGLPGDWSSMSRFVKAVFVKKNSRSDDGEKESVGQFFHMLASVEMPKGCIKINGRDDITQYSSCCNLNTGRYYYTTYTNRQINCVDMHRENLDGDKLISYPLSDKENIFYQN